MFLEDFVNNFNIWFYAVGLFDGMTFTLKSLLNPYMPRPISKKSKHYTWVV